MSNYLNTVLYIGITNNLSRRAFEHKSKFLKNSFTSTYNVSKLVYFEEYNEPTEAIKREKQIKSGSRNKKISLVNSLNPEWKDLFYNFG
jgi:putative endonuclease